VNLNSHSQGWADGRRGAWYQAAFESCPKRIVAKKQKVNQGVAFLPKSGIITTNLGKTATLTEIAGRERRVHHSKSLPLP
jgi:hypothetical protein